MPLGAKPSVLQLNMVWDLVKFLLRPVFAALYIYALYIATQAAGGFSTQSFLHILSMLSMLNLLINIIYFLIAIMLDIIGWTKERTTFSIIAFTLSLSVALIYWFMEAKTPGSLYTGLVVPMWWIHIVYTFPPVANLIDMIVAKPVKPLYAVALTCVLLIAFSYCIFLDIKVKFGTYVYPFLALLEGHMRYMTYALLILLMLVCMALVCSIAFVLYQLTHECGQENEYYDDTECGRPCNNKFSRHYWFPKKSTTPKCNTSINYDTTHVHNHANISKNTTCQNFNTCVVEKVEDPPCEEKKEKVEKKKKVKSDYQ